MNKDLKIAALGGGTGLSMLLKGLRGKYGAITAIVSVADDGGSSGILRREYSLLPPGDIRKQDVLIRFKVITDFLRASG